MYLKFYHFFPSQNQLKQSVKVVWHAPRGAIVLKVVLVVFAGCSSVV